MQMRYIPVLITLFLSSYPTVAFCQFSPPLPAPPLPPPPDPLTSFHSSINLSLQQQGVGVFSQSGSPFLSGVPSYQPLQANLGAPSGPVYGFAELLAGFDVASAGSADYPNIELLTTLNAGGHLRGRLQANMEDLPFSNLQRRTVGLPELYAEYYADGVMHKPTAWSGDQSYSVSLRLGKSGAVQYPYLDPITLFDRLPASFYSYTGALLMGEMQAPAGTGEHLSLFSQIANSGTTGSTFVSDAYEFYRHFNAPSHLFYEARLGMVPRNYQGSPANAAWGSQGYVGYESPHLGGGFFIGQSFRQGTSFGVSVQLGRNPVTQLLGLAPSKLLAEPASFAIEAPVALLYLGADSKPAQGEPAVGGSAEMQVWNDGTGVGVGATDVLPVGEWGVRSGSNLRRVVAVTPWWLYGDSLLRVPTAAGLRNSSGTENYVSYRSDVEVTYYQMTPQNEFAVAITAVDADTHNPIAGAALSLTSAGGTVFAAPLTRDAGTTRTDVTLKSGAALSVHVTGTAEGYQPAALDVPLIAGSVNRITVPFRRSLGVVRGTAMDSVSGKGIADAEIILTPPIGDYIVHTTDANGSFEFTGLRAGDYHIKLHRPGYSEVTLPASVTAGQSVVLELRSKAESGGVILRVVDPDGKGVAGASVTLQAGTGTTPLKTAATGSEGNLVQQLDPGTYSVSVTAPGYAPGSATITVGAGQLQNVTITLQKAP